MKKNIYSLKPLREILAASNNRYLEFISAIDDNTIGHKKLEKATETKTVEDPDYKGLNFFCKADKRIILTLARGEFNIYGFRCKDLVKHLVQSKQKYIFIKADRNWAFRLSLNLLISLQIPQISLWC